VRDEPPVVGSHIGFGVRQRLSSLDQRARGPKHLPRAPARGSSASGRLTRGRPRRYPSTRSRPRRWRCRRSCDCRTWA
jgi:hypothetical protein